MDLADLPEQARIVGRAFARALSGIMGVNLYGLYLYGAAIFPDPGRIHEIDCHVIVEAPPSDDERAQIHTLHTELAQLFPPPGGEVDAYYILRADAQARTPPCHQLNTVIRDEAWALHCAHVRAGYYVTLYGPAPTTIFPSPTWPATAAALDHELHFVERHLHYPAYGVLNLCRIIYSFRERNVVVSKRFSGEWAGGHYPHWTPLIQAARRVYDEAATEDDQQLLKAEAGRFLEFAAERIREYRDEAAAT